MNIVDIIEIRSIENEMLDELAKMLISVVHEGASIGFLPPLTYDEATNYWKTVMGPGVITYVATINGELTGSVQLHLCQKQNGSHRAEIAKLMTHPRHRRKGIAIKLMDIAEERATKEDRTLIILDTRKGDASNNLYSSRGYIQGGLIPGYAKSAAGSFDTTVIYYKNL